MKLEVLMSAMHQSDFTLGYKSRVKSDLLIINQCDKEDYEEILVDGYRWRMISTKERGLSKSRNMALHYAKGDICLWSDDDETFSENYAEVIIEAYVETPQAAAVVFNVNRINYSMKKAYYRIQNTREAPKYRGYQSGMLSFKRQDIINAQIQFDEKFGSGTPWGGGEEILFERDIREKGLKIYENPSEIATLDYGGGSQWFKGYNERYFYNLGAFAFYSRHYKVSLDLIIMVFYQCFYKLRKERKLSPFMKLNWMIRGMKGIKQNITYEQYTSI